LRVTEWGINKSATLGFAASSEAAASLFGSKWNVDPRWKLLRCGIDLAAFQGYIDRQAVRKEFSLAPGTFVVGHVGSFTKQKNHILWADIACEIARRLPTAHFLLVGDGPLRPHIEQQFIANGLQSQTTFTGLRDDVPRLLRGAFDVLLFPSLFEGLPLVVLEAQAAGLKAVISDTISIETDIVSELIRRIALSSPPTVWADAVINFAATQSISAEEALLRMMPSPFNAVTSSRELIQQYLLHS
jgi:glycosyltransferase involved in cell wall biosynthesis